MDWDRTSTRSTERSSALPQIERSQLSALLFSLARDGCVPSSPVDHPARRPILARFACHPRRPERTRPRTASRCYILRSPSGEQPIPFHQQRMFAGSFGGNLCRLQINCLYLLTRKRSELALEQTSGGKVGSHSRLSFQCAQGRRRYRISIRAQELRPRHKRDLRVRKFLLQTF